MDTIEEVIAAALVEFEGRDVEVEMLDDEGEAQLVVVGRLTGVAPVDEDGEVVMLRLARIGGEGYAGGLTLRGDVTAAWRDVELTLNGAPMPSDQRELVIEVGGREVVVCHL